ncbi:uncharacterized protein G2W53_024752 [Senna tora]|uniref:Uncharacterized protein n=1 Tax=Senna tora TaxID=362788 RepID=A0A834TC23_9FABA|nr:uncharacterized protein G2W53_024752 [Senna tora]
MHWKGRSAKAGHRLDISEGIQFQILYKTVRTDLVLYTLQHIHAQEQAVDS